MMPENAFGAWVKRRRKALDLTQEMLGDKVNCSAELIRKIEANVRRPSRELAILLASALAIPAPEYELFIALARGIDNPPAIVPSVLSLAGTRVLDQPDSAVIIRPDSGTIEDIRLTEADKMFALGRFHRSFLGMVTCSLETNYHASLAAGVRIRARELGIDVQIADSKFDPLIQSRLINQFVAQGAQALVVCPLDGISVRDALQNAFEAGVPAAETGIWAPPGGVAVNGMTDEQMGSAVGQYAAQVINRELNGRAVVAVLGRPDFQKITERANFMIAALREGAPAVTILTPTPKITVRKTLPISQKA